MSTIKSSTTTTTAYSVSADTTGTLVIQTGATPTTAVTVGTDQSVTLAGTLSLASQNMSPYTGFKSRIINGGMTIDQRNSGASVTPTNGAYTLDRWAAVLTQASKFTVEQTITGVSAPVGFTDYLAFTSSSAYSVLTGDAFGMYQLVEGFNCADLAWGTANAQTVTLSFWVRSSLTGTFGGSIINSSANRSYVFSYTISAANTWEQKSITIAGDQSGTWLTTNGVGLMVRYGLGSGSTFTGTAGSWGAGNIVQPTGSVSVVGTNTATWYITGVQLEKGSTATSFDYRPYGTELALCQRYFISYGGDASYERFANCVNTSTTQAIGMVSFPIQMRIGPSITSSGSLGLYNGVGISAVTTIAVDSAATKTTTASFNVASGLSTNAFTQAIANNSTATRLTFSAEL